MSIVARCECGNRISLADVMAGRTIPCPKCGGNVTVPTASAGATTSARRKVDATPSVAISPGIIISASVGLLVLVVVLVMYFGPWRVSNQWSAMSPRASTEVTDTVQFALQAYESQHQMWDAAQSHNTPTVEGVGFVPPVMAMSLPRHINFLGKTNQGNYRGTYDTSNGEIDVDIEVGGYTIGGQVDVRKSSGSFHATGREKDGVVSAECDGEPLKIIIPKPRGRDDL